MDEQIESNGNMTMIELDGSIGEGGGQILRTALSLSMVTGIPFRIDRIRAKRSKPGLLRQHLTSVNAATEICGAHIEGAVLGSTSLTFTPGTVKAGEYKFAIGSAGSCTLVFQTVLPALMLTNGVSRVTLEGGTHNQMAPPFHFIEHAFLPQLERMGVMIDARLERFGFYPAGGGSFTANITPVSQGMTLAPINIESRGLLMDGFAESFFAGVPVHVAERELATVGRIM
jgi:RNA 3'-terminal phosphate cyclase (ATP)